MKYLSKNRMFMMIMFATGTLSCLATVGVKNSGSESYPKDKEVVRDSPEVSDYYHTVDSKNSDIIFAPYTKTH